MPESTVTKSAQPEGSHKEFVESILVAFILAFIFRAFVVEAFVIPTGSMGPTLYGAHMRYHCPDCGYTFDAGYSTSDKKKGSSDDDLDIPATGTPHTKYHCPNCGYEMPVRSDEPIRYGDRILVLKYLYLFQKPQQWDVVVFKSPSEPGMVEDPEYAQNFIKRLIATGPASVVVLDGDVYLGPADAERPSSFKIQRKPRHVQDALWRVVCDNDFIPHMGASSTQSRQWIQPWQEEVPSSGWKLSGPGSPDWPQGTPARIFDFSNPNGSGAIVFHADANPDTNALKNWLVYDEADHPKQRLEDVNDLKLTCDYTRKSGAGPLRLQLSKRLAVFTAEFTPGGVSLFRSPRPRPDQKEKTHEELLASAALAGGSGPMRIELINVDYRVSVRVNGVEVIQTTDKQYYPNVSELWYEESVLQGWTEGPDEDASKRLEQARQRLDVEKFAGESIVRIEARQQDARIEHLVLSRDIYYMSIPPDSRVFWASVRKVTHLKAGEYFVMGDNSAISGDARYWDKPVILPREGLNIESGRVPEQFMLGKAFFVYWPAGYPVVRSIPVNAVPDFGEMRFIR